MKQEEGKDIGELKDGSEGPIKDKGNRIGTQCEDIET